MKQYPVIGIPAAPHKLGPVLPVYETPGHYLEAVAQAGGIPVLLPMLPEAGDDVLAQLIAGCDGFVLPGGGDFDPDWYGQEPLPDLEEDPTSMDRACQETSLRFVRMAAASGKPVLGICLGMQALAIALGGSLYQDIPTQRPSPVPHRMPIEKESDRWQLAHDVRTEADSLVRRLCGEELTVNSFHHQAVRDLPEGFRVTAWAEDGIPEAMERGNLLGVQWHPENLSHIAQPQAQALFRWLTETARG